MSAQKKAVAIVNRMKMTAPSDHIHQAVQAVKQGGLIAYPTEGVYGLGCSPFDHNACQRLYQLKQRPTNKPFIWVASCFDHVAEFINTEQVPDLHAILTTWPGAITWVFPLSQKGKTQLPTYHTLAVRISAHPIVRALCQALTTPLISTSANLAGKPALCTTHAVKAQFANQVDYIVPGRIGDLTSPTPIYDAITRQILRGTTQEK